MRSYMSMLMRQAGGWSVIALASAGGLRAVAADSFGGSGLAIVESFAVSGDLDLASSSGPAPTIAVRKSAVTRSTLTSVKPVAAKTGAAGSTFFTNSKSVVPLLVADLEPAAVPVSRPMAGRSVGVRPSMPRSITSAAR